MNTTTTHNFVLTSLATMATQYPGHIGQGLAAEGRRVTDAAWYIVVVYAEVTQVTYRNWGDAVPRGARRFETAEELGAILPQLSAAEAAAALAAVTARRRRCNGFYHQPGWMIQPNIEVDGDYPV